MNETQKKLLTVSEVAERLRCSRFTVYRHVDSGQIPAIKLGAGPRAPLRIAEAELDTWLTS